MKKYKEHVCLGWRVGFTRAHGRQPGMFKFVSTIYSTLKSNTPRILKKEKKTLNTKSIFTINLTQSILRGLPSITQPCHTSPPRISDLSVGVRSGPPGQSTQHLFSWEKPFKATFSASVFSHLEHFGKFCLSSHWKIISRPTTAP